MEALDEVLSAIQAHAIYSGDHSISLKPSICDSWSDQDIIRRFEEAKSHPDSVYMVGGKDRSRVRVLCGDTVVKLVRYPHYYKPGPPPEYLALQFVHQHTTIPVPRIRRLIMHEEGWHYLVLEKINGHPLHQIWPLLSASQRFGVALTLRDYIVQLHRASKLYHRDSFPGPMGPEPRKCFGIGWLFSDRTWGPFGTSSELVNDLNTLFDLPETGMNAKGSYPGKLVDSYPLVLTHGDLSLRNVMVGSDGRLWVLDWEWSGFYPPWCEHIATLSAADNDATPSGWMAQKGVRKAAQSWWNYVPFVTGSWPLERKLLCLQNYQPLRKKDKYD